MPQNRKSVRLYGLSVLGKAHLLEMVVKGKHFIESCKEKRCCALQGRAPALLERVGFPVRNLTDCLTAQPAWDGLQIRFAINISPTANRNTPSIKYHQTP